jgi:hypothetical protein
MAAKLQLTFIPEERGKSDQDGTAVGLSTTDAIAISFQMVGQ